MHASGTTASEPAGASFLHDVLVLHGTFVYVSGIGRSKQIEDMKKVISGKEWDGDYSTRTYRPAALASVSSEACNARS